MDWKVGLDSTFSDLFVKRNLLLLGMSWLGGVAILVGYGTLSGRLPHAVVSLGCDLPHLGKNETGPFQAARHGAESGQRPTYSVMFDNLRADNAPLGCLRTAAYKRVHIDNLRIKFFQPPTACGADGGADFRLAAFCDLFAPRPVRDSGASPLGLFDDLQGPNADWSVSIDLSNGTEVRIRNMDWEICREGETVLRLRCRYAYLGGGVSHVRLQGHATVSTGGATLESNAIEMDVENERFIVKGRYCLTRDGRQQAGCGGCFDAALRSLDTTPCRLEEDKTWADGLQF